MNYSISREGKEYGPYTLADLQRYVALGNILVTDLTRSEGMTEWVLVSQVIGNIPLRALPSNPAAADPVLRREGNKLIVGQGAVLPPYCVKCAQPPVEPALEKNFVWCNPLFALLLILGLIGIIVYSVAYYSRRKQMKLTVPLCDQHRRARRIQMWLGAISMITSPALLIIAGVADKENLALIGFVLFLIMVLGGAVMLIFAAPLRAKKIDDQQGTFAGAGDPFLQIVDSLGPQTSSGFGF